MPFEHPLIAAGPVDHRFMKLGANRAEYPNKLMLHDFITEALAPPPPSCNLTNKITNLGMMLNDQIGDCTCAAIGHIIQQWTAENDAQSIIPDQIILKLYEDVSGYKPNDPSTDNGAQITDVLNYVQKHGLYGHKLEGSVGVNVANSEHIENGVYIFGALDTAVMLPLSCQTQTVWDVVEDDGSGNTEPGSWGGHSVPLCAYDEEFYYVITWGKILKVAKPFWTKYFVQAEAPLGTDWINKVTQKSPTGFDVKALESALKSACS